MRGSPFFVIFFLFSLVGTHAPRSSAAVLRVGRVSPALPVEDGASWQTAYHSIEYALRAAQAGDEIWVARVPSPEDVVVDQPRITLIGGFRGDETTSTPLGEAPTYLAGTGGDHPVIAVTPQAFGFTLRGFHVTGGRRGGGISIQAGNVTITGNTITGNGVDGGPAGGISVGGSSGITISHNLITRNKAGSGAGIRASGAAVIVNNVIEENTASATSTDPLRAAASFGGGIYVSSGFAIIKNNEIAFNTVSATGPSGDGEPAVGYGGGVAIREYATLANNTIAFNKVLRPGSSEGAAGTGGGVYFDGDGFIAGNIIAGNAVEGEGPAYTHGGLAFGPRGANPAVLSRNLFHANTPDDSTDYAGANGNISGDPLFVGPGQFFYNFRLQPGSPAVDAGDDVYADAADVDQAGNARVQGRHVDIGAYEMPPTGNLPARLYVRPDGSDTADGLTWATARATIAAAIESVAVDGEVWVAAGTYPGRITLRSRVSVLGGFAGTETRAGQRDVRAHATILDGEGQGPAVLIPAAATDTRLDGFTVRNGGRGSVYVGGLMRVAGAGVASLGTGAVIANSRIEENHIRTTDGNQVAYGAGIYIPHGSATVRGNVIRGNTLHVERAQPLPYEPDQTQAHGGGLYLENAEVTVLNNLVVANAVTVVPPFRGEALPLGSGVYARAVTGLIANNTVSGNVASAVRSGNMTPKGGAVYLESTTGALTLANNIVAFNESGVMQRVSQARFQNNDIFGNGTDTAEITAAPPSAEDGNISADPLFVDRAAGDFHLLPTSPAVDAGSGAYVSTETDLDGRPRVTGARVDMGAYELPPFVGAVQALRIAGGLDTAPADLSALDVEAGGASAGVVDIADAVRLMRTAGE